MLRPYLLSYAPIQSAFEADRVAAEALAAVPNGQLSALLDKAGAAWA